MAKSVYIETTIVSYLTAWPSRDLVRAAQQQITKDWWAIEASRFDLCTSELVLLEASTGDTQAAADRLKALESLKILAISEDAIDIAEALLAAAALPPVAARDAQHVGIAATNGIDVLLTWNCRHLAHVLLRDKIDEVCDAFGVRAPKVCTPAELLGGPP